MSAQKKPQTKTRRDKTTVGIAEKGENRRSPRYVLIQHEVCEFLDAMKFACQHQPEQGGIFIGNHRDDHIEVTKFTEPGPNDRGTLSRFRRKDRSHQIAADEAWQASGQTESYIGEWHSHPSGIPQYSVVDRKAWDGVVRKIGRDCVFVVVAPKGWAVYRLNAVGAGAAPLNLTFAETGKTGLVFA